MGEPSGIPGGRPTVNSPAHLHRVLALGRVHQHRSPVGVLEEELPVMGRLGLVPSDVDLEGDGRGDRVRSGHAPPTAQHVELAVGHLGGVAQHHGHSHET